MNILICDDDKLYVDMIRKYVDEFFADHKITDYKVYEYNSGDEVAKNNEKIDIAFLDVEMDGINGIEAGKCLRNNNKNIVLFIITSYDRAILMMQWTREFSGILINHWKDL